MKYIVTGACGFVGSNLTKELLRQGHQVLAIDDGSLGVRENLPSSNDKLFVEFGSKDVNLGSRWYYHFTSKPDGVFHLAAQSSAPMYSAAPSNTMATNVIGFNEVAQFCSIDGVPLVFASTSSMMRQGRIPDPQTFYELAKFQNEWSARVYQRELGLNATGLRFFSVYGPGETHKGKYANLVTQFLKAAMADEEVVVYGDGRQSRDFVFVGDLVRAIVLAMEREHQRTELAGSVRFHSVGTGHRTSINRLIEHIEALVGKNAKVKYVENPIKNYVKHTQADEDDLMPGWNPEVSLNYGLRKTLEYLEDERNAEGRF